MDQRVILASEDHQVHPVFRVLKGQPVFLDRLVYLDQRVMLVPQGVLVKMVLKDPLVPMVFQVSRELKENLDWEGLDLRVVMALLVTKEWLGSLA